MIPDASDWNASHWPNHELSQFVMAAGIRWHLQEAGSGAPLLLVHGTGSSVHSWRELLPLLARRFRVIAADLPGHGFSGSLPAANRSIGGMSRALTALLNAKGIEPRFCVGHSAGAVILCRMAMDAAIEPRVIVSLNGAFLPLRGPAGVLFSPLAKLLAKSSLFPRLLARRAGHPANIARLLASTGSRLDPLGVDLYSRLVRNPQHLAGALGMMSEWDLNGFERELSKLATPLVLLAGSNDRTVPATQAREVAARVAHASVRILPELGHLAHEERPRLIAEEILRVCRPYEST